MEYARAYEWVRSPEWRHGLRLPVCRRRAAARRRSTKSRHVTRSHCVAARSLRRRLILLQQTLFSGRHRWLPGRSTPVVQPAPVLRPSRTETGIREVAQVASVHIHQPDSKRQPLVAARVNERYGVAIWRPQRDAHGHVRIAFVSNLTQPALLDVYNPQVCMTAGVGEKRDLFIIGASRWGEYLPGLSRHTNAAAYILCGLIVDWELRDVGLQLHAAHQYCATLGDVRIHVRRFARCDLPDAPITQGNLPQA